ncbi:MAG TPA: GYD domain-containing protein, partial [Gaiellaceae bacterium]|nr:GYD domain-containing protein [Gaiellaceae bacterium]
MRWTSKGMAGLPGWRERVEEGERMIEEAGGRLVGVYVTLGRYDVVEIFEAPNDESAAEILMKLQRFGAEQSETLRAFTRE